MAKAPSFTLTATAENMEELTYSTNRLDKVHLTIRRWALVLDAKDFRIDGEIIDSLTLERLTK